MVLIRLLGKYSACFQFCLGDTTFGAFVSGALGLEFRFRGALLA